MSKYKTSNLLILSVTIPAKLKKQLIKIAKQEEVSVSHLITRILVDNLEGYEHGTKWIQ